MSKVSVILPMYNNKEDVLTAIQSVITQTYKIWELIIVDDMSDDGSYELVISWITRYNTKHGTNQITMYRNTKNQGCYVSINEGLKYVTGTYVTRIDSDDKFERTKLEKQVFILDNDDKLVAVSGISVRGRTRIRDNEITLMYRRSVFDKIGFFDSVRFAADSEFNHRMETYFGANCVLRTKDIVYWAKVRANSLTRSTTTGIFTQGRPIRKQYVEDYMKWHAENQDNKEKLYVEYPLTIRSIKVPDIMLP